MQFMITAYDAAVSSDRIQMVKLYQEGNPEVKFQIRGVKKIFYYKILSN